MHIVINDTPDELPEETFDRLFLWQSYQEVPDQNVISIPIMVEKKAVSLRERYLALIFAMGEAKIGELSLVERLEMRPGFSYWWMSQITEKCNYSKSPHIDDIIRFLAFEEWAQGYPSIKTLKLISANVEIQSCIKKWCQEKNIHFEWKQSNRSSVKISKIRNI
ncbi:MAG: hypothetical protein P8M81_07705 [Litorivicinaceae bacterium]|nr:hypothetical protein [Litorivicinaceae bacterium]